MCDKMGLQVENAPSKAEIIESWVTLGGDPDEVYEMVEGGVIVFDTHEEHETWLKQKKTFT